MIFSRLLAPTLLLHQPEVVNPKLAPDQRAGRLTDDFQQQEGRVWAGMKSRLLQTPGAGTENIVAKNIGNVVVSVHDRKTRTARCFKLFRPAFGTELVLGVRF